MNKRILRLALPNIVSNITVPLLSLVDLGLMGHQTSAAYIGAISIAGMIFTVLYWGFAFLRMSTSGFTAQSYGARKLDTSVHVLMRSIFTALIAGVVLISLQDVIAWISFKLVNGSGEVEALARQYFYIRIFAAPATIALYSISGWFIGMQNAISPMFVAIVINILNIALSFLFVMEFDMDVKGVALATVLAQYSGLIMALAILRVKYFKIIKKYFRWKSWFVVKDFLHFFRVSNDIFIRTGCVIFVFVMFYSKSAAQDEILLAANSLLIQFLLFFSFFIDGFAYAGEALAGKYVGSSDLKSLKMVIRRSFLWGFSLAIAFTAIYFVFGEDILRVLTDQEDVIKRSAGFLIWLALIPLFSVTSFIWDGIYIGATASKAMRNTMLIATFALFFPVFYFGLRWMGPNAIWLALSLFFLGRGVLQTIIYKKAILTRCEA